MTNGPFKVDIRNGDLEGLERVKTIGLFSNGLAPNTQVRLDKDKLELKEYTKETIMHWDGLEIVENIASKQSAYDGAYAAES